jgi:hypothetical protein
MINVATHPGTDKPDLVDRSRSLFWIRGNTQLCPPTGHRRPGDLKQIRWDDARFLTAVVLVLANDVDQAALHDHFDLTRT